MNGRIFNTQHMAKKRLAVLQSNYIPWKGYFDLIHAVDEFVLYDIVQYTKNDWRNRNKIKTPAGTSWLSIPVSRGHLHQSIRMTTVANQVWRSKHWKSLCQYYSKARYFNYYKALFEHLYMESQEERLSNINFMFINAINEILGIQTTITWAQDLELGDDRNRRLLELCKQAGASHYLTGPAAMSYLDMALFKQHNITVTVFDYNGYPTYNQFFPPFVHQVSILDLIFHEGPDATRFMKTFGA